MESKIPHMKDGKTDESTNDLWVLIKNDDVQSFSKYISVNGIDMSKLEYHYSGENDNLFYHINYDSLSILDYAAYKGSINILKFILINGLKIPNSTFKWGVNGGNHEIIEFLENHSDHKLSDSFLDCAIEYHRNDIAKYIIEHFDGDESNYGYYISACGRYSNTEMIFTMLHNESFKIKNYHFNDNNFIHDIIINGNLLLFEYIYYAQSQDLWVNFSMIDAVRYHSNEIIKFIVEKSLYNGRKYEAIDQEENSPLMVAFYCRNIEAVDLLIRVSNLKHEDSLKNTVLYAAIQYGDIKYIKLLLRKCRYTLVSDVCPFKLTPEIEQLLDQYKIPKHCAAYYDGYYCD